MKSIFSRRAIIVVALVLISTIALGSWAKSRRSDENVLQALDAFAKVIEKVQSFYVDEVDTQQLITGAIENMLKELDPHSQFLSGLDYDDLMMSTQGQFGGLGIFISFRDNYPTVISPIEGTPADRAGLQGGDRIVEIEGEPSTGWQVQKAVRFLRGEPGTNVRFKIARPGDDGEPIEYNLVREEIRVKSVSYSGMFDDYGYIKLSSFSKNTRSELQQALRNLESEAPKGLVLDLRSNPGGLLQAATGVSELFLEKDKLVVYTKGRYSQNNHKYYSSRARAGKKYPIVVMVNGNSASASEIVAGALQDWDAALVVGQTTFGKGTVQTVFSLSDSQAVKLTTAKYYTPSGRSIHRDNAPDEVIDETAETSDADEGNIAMRRADDPDGELKDRPIFHTSGGRSVYGGGGITPDVEFEPIKYGELERRLERDALFFTFAVDYSTDHEVTRDFEVTDKVIASFKQMLKEREFEFEDEDFSGTSLEYVKRAIVREMVSKNFGRRAMYREMLLRDKDFNQVLQIFGKAPSLQAMFEYAQEQKALKKASLE